MVTSTTNPGVNKGGLEVESGTGNSTNLRSIHEQLTLDANQEKKDVTTQQSEDSPEYIEGWRLAAIMITVFLSTLLGSLDVGIVATAIPGITDDFHQLNDVGWYGGAIFLGLTTTSPIWGKLFKYFPVNIVYLTSVAIFLIGSIVAATAPSSVALIIGRAIQGWGCSGTIGGSAMMISYVAEPKKRPMLIGMWVGVFMGSTIIGPLIGGAFTTNVTWRWCFWVNLPLGGVIVVMLLIFLRVPKHIKPVPATWIEIVRQLDLPGFATILASLVCFTLSLQNGGQAKPWNDGSVIATLVMWVALATVFFVVEWYQGEYAMLPLHLLKPRLAWTNSLLNWIGNLANYQTVFYLPIYFQTIQGQSAITSGVNSLPFVSFFAVGAVLSGFLIGKTRLLQPYQILSALLATAGSALMYTLKLDSSKARYIGPQILLGFGIGLGNQVPLTTLQTFSSPEDLAQIAALMIMFNSLSGAYFVTAAQSLFANRLLQTLASTAPSINAAKVLATGATEIKHVFAGVDLDAILHAYMVGIKDVFAFALGGSAFTVLLALIVPFKKIPNHGDQDTEKVVMAV